MKSAWSFLILAFTPVEHLRKSFGWWNFAQPFLLFTGLAVGPIVGTFFDSLQPTQRLLLIVACPALILVMLFFIAGIRLQRTADDLNTPKLDLIFNPDDRTCAFEIIEVDQDQKGMYKVYDLYRLGIMNRSLRTIEDVSVRIESVEGWDPGTLPLHLQLMHDRHPFKTTFAVRPNDKPEVYVDFIGREPDVYIFNLHAIPLNVQRSFDAKKRKITVVAVGRDIRPARKVFVVEPNGPDGIMITES